MYCSVSCQIVHHAKWHIQSVKSESKTVYVSKIPLCLAWLAPVLLGQNSVSESVNLQHPCHARKAPVSWDAEGLLRDSNSSHSSVPYYNICLSCIFFHRKVEHHNLLNHHNCLRFETNIFTFAYRHLNACKVNFGTWRKLRLTREHEYVKLYTGVAIRKMQLQVLETETRE